MDVIVVCLFVSVCVCVDAPTGNAMEKLEMGVEKFSIQVFGNWLIDGQTLVSVGCHFGQHYKYII